MVHAVDINQPWRQIEKVCSLVTEMVATLSSRPWVGRPNISIWNPKVIRIHDVDTAIVEVADVSRSQRGAMNPSNAGDDCICSRDWPPFILPRCHHLAVTISRLRVKDQKTLIGLGEQGIGTVGMSTARRW